ncbi:MAG TPA: hypothetical protein VFE57_07675 [Cyclobacteriaceae bacterium]|jgi:hypothetical protein|nr:hypothetical protein [Cyclobacteriaceae bacterium]
MENSGIDLDRLFLEGVYIMSIEYYRHKVNLYSLDSSFVEVYYDDDLNKIVKVHRSEADDLNKFLSRIDKLEL